MIAAKKNGGKPPATLPKPTAVPAAVPIAPTAIPAAPAPSVAAPAAPAAKDDKAESDLEDDEFEARQT